MKKILALGAACLLGTNAQAQNNVVKVDILRPVTNTGAFSFEHKLSESSSFQLTLSFTANYKDNGGRDFGGMWYYNERRTSGFGIMPAYRFYLSEKHPALEGFYVMPFVRYQYLSQTADEYYAGRGSNPAGRYDATLNAFGGGMLVGRHWIFKRRFSLDANLGPEYMGTSVSAKNWPDVKQGEFLGFNTGSNYNLNGGLTFGVAF